MQRSLPVVLVLLVLVVCVGRAEGRKPDPPNKMRADGKGIGQMLAAPNATMDIDTLVLGQWTFDDGLGNPDPQGWTAVDLTTQNFTYFHVDDFGGLGGGAFGRLTPIAGLQSMWCGARPCSNVDNCHYATLPGYGSEWRQQLKSVDFTVTGNVSLDLKIRYDSEPSYDITHLEFASGAGSWTELASFTGIGTQTLNYVVPAASHTGSVRFRFRFESDGAWSDEDGFWNTDGAVMVDDLVVSDLTGMIDFQDFESESVGDNESGDVDWVGSPLPGYGIHAALFDGNTTLQEDVDYTNLTSLWGFYSGSAYNYACGGHPEQLAVPFSKSVDGTIQYMHNEIQSPSIPLLPGFANPAVLLRFDVYRNLPLENLVFFQYRVRSLVGGTWGAWRDDNLVHYGDQKDWFTFSRNLFPLIDAGATAIQVGIGALDQCSVWCGVIPGSGVCHSHAPLIDNVRVGTIPYAYSVTNTNASGSGSFYQAVLDVNANPSGPGLIQFAIPGNGPFTVPPGVAITRPVVIDGFSQASSSPNTSPISEPADAVIEILIPGDVSFQGGNSLLQGVAVYSVTLASNDNRVEGCFLGFDTGGLLQNYDTGNGLSISGTGNTVGGTAARARNVIGSYSGYAVSITSTGNVVEGNFIGTNRTGVASALFDQGAIRITRTGNRVGGTSVGSRNVIAFYNNGIFFDGSLAFVNQVVGNYIGVDRTGAALFGSSPSANAAVMIADGDGNVIGGATAAERNIIAGPSYGVLIGNLTGSTRVQGNYFGTDASGTNALGLGVGVHVAANPVIKNKIGGTLAGEGNLFSGTGDDAIQVLGGDGTFIARNIIVSPAGLGIDLSPDGVTANDPGDGDVGANSLQNFPVLTSAVVGVGTTSITGTLDSTPGKSFQLEFFANSACNASGHGDAETFLGTATVTADGSGIAPINAVIPVAAPPGWFVTATARNSGDATSELSACILIINTPSGSSVAVSPVDAGTGTTPATVTFDQVSGAGVTSLVIGTSGPPLPSSFTAGSPHFYDLTTTASFTGDLDVCIVYDEGALVVPEASLRLAHYDGSVWVDITTSLDTGTNTVCGTTDHLSPFALGSGSVTGVGPTVLPRALALHPNVPNPFNPSTTIAYDVPVGGTNVTIRIYDVSGRLVRTLVDGRRTAGTHATTWDGRSDAGETVSSGIYFYRMVAGSFSEARRMVLLK